MDQEPAESFALQHGGRDPTALIVEPQPGVDRAIRLQGGRRERQIEPAQRAAQGDALGAVRVEERMVEVEEDGANRQAGLTSRDT
jgi:hypothetical protein